MSNAKKAKATLERRGLKLGPIYQGFDPTATSLHTGHLVGIMAMAHLQELGHRPIAVIGGGDSAFQEGLFLTRFANKLNLVHRRNEFRAQGILQDRLLGMDKVKAITPATVKEIGGDTQVRWVDVDRDGAVERIPVGGVFVFVGFATPDFWLAVMLQILFGVHMGWLPISVWSLRKQGPTTPGARCCGR